MVYNRGVHQNVHQLLGGHFAGIVALRARQPEGLQRLRLTGAARYFTTDYDGLLPR
jgi:hypothetical protein